MRASIGWVRVAIAADLMLGGFSIPTASAQGILRGVVRTSNPAAPVSGIAVLVDGDSIGVTDDAGGFIVRFGRPGPRVVMLRQARYLPVLRGLEYRIDVGDDGAESSLEVVWPSLDDLIARECAGAGPRGSVAVLGFVRSARVAVGDSVEVVAGWNGAAPGRFGGMAVRASGEGAYLFCGVPGAQEVRLYARRGLAAGAVRTLVTPPAGFVEVTIYSPEG